MSEAESKSTEPFILFELDKTTYGVHSRSVQQLEMIEEITPVPNAPDFVEGLVLSRGQVIPAINMRTRFGFKKIKHDSRTRLLVISSDERTVGFVVDTAREFISIPSNQIKPPPESIVGLSGKYLTGIAMLDNRQVLILDVKEVLKLSKDSLPVPENN